MKTSTLKFKELFNKTYGHMLQHQEQLNNKDNEIPNKN